MKNTKRSLTCAAVLLTAVLLILNSCKKQEAPTDPQPDRISMIRTDFETRHLAEKLTAQSEKVGSLTLDWVIQWNSGQVQTKTKDSSTYTYIPMLPRLDAGNKAVRTINYDRYLLVQETKGKYHFSLAHAYSENTGNVARKGFTGLLQIKDLEQNGLTQLAFKEGIKAIALTKNKMMSLKKLAYGEECYSTYSCSWGTVCSGGIVYITYTTGQSCEPPSMFDPCGNSSDAVSWSFNGSYEISRTCFPVSPPVDPPAPGDNPGGGMPPTQQELIDQFYAKIYLAELPPCLKSVLHSLMYQSEGSVVQMIQKLSGEVPGYRWIVLEETLDENVNGQTTKVPGGAATRIDKAKYFYGTDLAIARTILHEAVHAYLVCYFADNPLLANLSYEKMLEEWQKIKKPNLNDIHHIEMTLEYRNEIAKGLMEYGDMHGYTFDSEAEKTQFYSDMAWGGLEETKAFQALSTSEKNRIRDTLLSEQNGTDRNGNPKTPKGKISGC